LKVLYSARYRIDIGPHVFPTRKYSLVHAGLLEDGVIQPSDCVEPDAASWNDLALVHTADYLNKMRDGTMSPEDTAQLELPWSPEMVEGFRLMTGGTIQAALIACGFTDEDRTQRARSTQSQEFSAVLRALRSTSCHIGGGLHHAFPNHGEGFCPFNDVSAVAARVLQARSIAHRNRRS
jgi:acetoin utilization deacetylase AcuC-like enzyme